MSERAWKALEALEALTIVIGLTPIAGDRQLLHEAYDDAKEAIDVLRAELMQEEDGK